ncbi:MAG: Rid family detoxifying hydrolase [Acidobacteriota bacterium]
MRTAITTKDAPQAIGPYSQAVRAGNLIFVSGQGPIDPATGALSAGDIGEQTRLVLRNIASILGAGGASMDQVVRTTVYLADMNDFAAMNAAYAEAFSSPAPARTTIQAARLPRDMRVEIDVIAAV